jgi:hypothetical protein
LSLVPMADDIVGSLEGSLHSKKIQRKDWVLLVALMCNRVPSCAKKSGSKAENNNILD